MYIGYLCELPILYTLFYYRLQATYVFSMAAASTYFIAYGVQFISAPSLIQIGIRFELRKLVGHGSVRIHRFGGA